MIINIFTFLSIYLNLVIFVFLSSPTFELKSNEDGIHISTREEHPLKAFSSIIEIEAGIDTVVKYEHPKKARFPIDVNETPKEISFNDEHPANV